MFKRHSEEQITENRAFQHYILFLVIESQNWTVEPMHTCLMQDFKNIFYLYTIGSCEIKAAESKGTFVFDTCFYFL